MEVDHIEVTPKVLDDKAQQDKKNSGKAAKRKTTFTICLFRHPKDWHAVQELPFEVDEGSGVDLSVVAQMLNIGNNCDVGVWVCPIFLILTHTQVVDPRNFKPYFQYVPQWLEPSDVKDMIEGGIMRVICTK